ncbi:MAG: aa3-type cytochrome c oxidase subunit IV [Parvibaculaceae bacterium]
MDAPEHESTYEGFVAFTKYGIIGSVVLLVLMAIFLL